MEYSKKGCGCETVPLEHFGRVVSEIEIQYCPKHKAAPLIYADLRGIVDKYGGIGTSGFMAYLGKNIAKFRQDLAKAENK